MDVLCATADQLIDAQQTGELSAREIVRACLDVIERRDGAIGSFLDVWAEDAYARAADVDRRRVSGKPLGSLAGVPVSLKDVICTAGHRTTCGSHMLRDFVPPYDATIVEQLRAADAIVMGKTNLDEFAMGGSTENSALQPTVNPWHVDRSPGGSSGGAAAGVAAGLVPLAVGSDTGGSIRQPAAFCGVVGLKPTYGRVSRYGLVAFASSLDQLGPLGHTAADTARLLQVLAGHDPRDSTSCPEEVPDYADALDGPLRDLRIGVIREHLESPALDPEIAQAVEAAAGELERLGARRVDVSLPHNRYGVATYYLIAPCEASSNLARYDGVHYGHRTDRAALERREREAEAAGIPADERDGMLVQMYRRSRSEGLGPEVKRRIMLGTFALSAGYYEAYYLKALRVRRLIRNDVETAFERADLLLGPTTPTPAFPLGSMSDPLEMYLQDLYTVTANLAGIPAMSLPCGFTRGGLPIGLQLQGPPFCEPRLLQVAHRYQQATDWHLRRIKQP